MIKYIPMQISVIIPTLNAGPYIETLLSALSAQDAKPSEIIIIDSSSEDNTVEIAKRFGAKTMMIPRHTFNHGKTRNMAAIEASGDILVFITQDALPFHTSLISNLTAPLRKQGIPAAYGRHIPRPDASPLEIFARQFNYPDSPMTKSADDINRYGIKAFFFSNVCSAIMKNIFVKVGMFPERVRTNEDMLLSARLILNGHKVAYVPDAVVVHSHNYSLFEQFKRYYNIGSFMKSNNWLLKYAHPEGEGLKFVKEEFFFVLNQHKYSWIPYIFLEHMAKYAGYRMGLIAG